jgi:MFS family permease
VNFKKFVVGIPYLAWAVTYVALCWGLFAAILGAVTPELRDELGNYKQLGVLMMVWASGNVLGAIQGGRIAQAYPARTLFLSYCCAAAVALGVIVLSPAFWGIALGFFGIAMVESALITLSHSILADVYTEPQARSRVLSLVDVAFSAGTLITPGLVIGLHHFSTSWRLPYALFLLPLGAAILAFVPRKPFQPFATAHPLGTTNPGAVVPTSYLQLMRNPLVAVCMAAGLLTGYIEWGQYFWYVSYGTQTQALSPNAARFGMQCFVTGMCVVRCWQAFFHSAWPLGQKLWRLNLLAVLGLGMAVLVPHHGMAMVYGLSNLLFGMGVGVVFPMLLALMIDAAPSQSSKLSALLMISVTGGAQVAGLLIGILADWVGVQWAYSTLWLAGLAFTVVIWQLRPVKKNGLAALA